jgi:hypothetical protein
LTHSPKLFCEKVNFVTAFRRSSLLDFQQEIGEEAINRYLAQKGMSKSGAGTETLRRFTNQLVADEGERLFRMLGIGSNAAAGQANSLANFAPQIASAQMAQGSAEASGIIGGANAWRGTLQDLTKAASFATTLWALNGAGSGPSGSGSSAPGSDGSGVVNIRKWGGQPNISVGDPRLLSLADMNSPYP